MKVTELRNAVPVMTEDMLLELWEQYETFADRNPDSDEGRYKQKIAIIEEEVEREDRPHVDAKRAKTWGYWNQ